MDATRIPWFLAIGASGGEGLNDIKHVLAALPSDLEAVVMVVLHRPWEQISNLRAVLARGSRLPVLVAADGDRLKAGTVYIGEPSEHLTLIWHSIAELVDDPLRRHQNRTVDLLFISLAEFAKARTIAV